MQSLQLIPVQILWAFSIWLESVAILPQLFMLQRTGEAETITTHYLFALGIYRALYILNWIYRYFSKEYIEPIAVIAGIIQTILYSDFFWIYYTKFVLSLPVTLPIKRTLLHLICWLLFEGFSKGKSFRCPSKEAPAAMLELAHRGFKGQCIPYSWHNL